MSPDGPGAAPCERDGRVFKNRGLGKVAGVSDSNTSSLERSGP